MLYDFQTLYESQRHFLRESVQQSGIRAWLSEPDCLEVNSGSDTDQLQDLRKCFHSAIVALPIKLKKEQQLWHRSDLKLNCVRPKKCLKYWLKLVFLKNSLLIFSRSSFHNFDRQEACWNGMNEQFLFAAYLPTCSLTLKK